MSLSPEDQWKLDGIQIVNGCLAMLANDADLQSDLEDEPMVKLAIEHWSGSSRMPTETYMTMLADNLRVQSVYPKIKMLQTVCQSAKIGLPLDHLLKGKSELDTIVLTRAYGTDFCIKHNLTRPLTPLPPKRAAVDDADEGPLPPTPTSRRNSSEQRVDGFSHINRTKSINSKSGNSSSSSSSSVDSSARPPLIDFWRVFKDAMRDAEWKEIFMQVFQQQALAFAATLLIAYFMGYLPVEDLLARLFRR